MASTLIVDQLQKTGGSTTALTLPTSNASADEFLKNDGAGALSWASAGGGLLGLVVYTSSGTYTVGATTNGTAGNQGSADVSKVIIECQAAGGAGASRGGTGSAYQGGSGGGGAYSKTFRDLTDITSITIVVPTGPAGGSPGAAGGAASLTKASGSGTFATITCDGGSAGGSPSGTTQGASGAGAAVPTTGDINIGGGIGPAGGEGQGARSGFSFMGVGQAFPNGVTTGPAPVGYGSGGICGPTSSPGTGGAGGAGIVLIWEYA